MNDVRVSDDDEWVERDFSVRCQLDDKQKKPISLIPFPSQDTYTNWQCTHIHDECRSATHTSRREDFTTAREPSGESK